MKNTTKAGMFNISKAYVRDAILYYTIQQYFNNNDKKTCEYINQLEKIDHFNFRSGLKNIIPYLSSKLNISEKEFYNCYLKVKDSFAKLTDDVILVKKGDGIYSKLLADTQGTPPFLFLKGNVHLLNEKSVCVVGSRNATIDSMKKTEKIVKSLIKRNLVVNAGLAKGIDTVTHKSALQNGGRTIAVIGTPINQYYPKENKELQLAIEEKGLVVSQFPPCNPVYRWNFPTRNGTLNHSQLLDNMFRNLEKSYNTKHPDAPLPHLSCHVFRHTGCALTAKKMFKLGIDPIILQQWMGHASLKMTLNLYNHASKNDHSAAIDEINELDKNIG